MQKITTVEAIEGMAPEVARAVFRTLGCMADGRMAVGAAST